MTALCTSGAANQLTNYPICCVAVVSFSDSMTNVVQICIIHISYCFN